MIDNPKVQTVFDSYSETIQDKLYQLRQIILDTAAELESIGTIEETLKWGQISYLTHKPKSGTTIRIDQYGIDSEQVAIFVHCQTTLIDAVRQMYPDTFAYEGTRAIIFDDLDDERTEALKHCIELALTYHQRK